MNANGSYKTICLFVMGGDVGELTWNYDTVISAKNDSYKDTASVLFILQSRLTNFISKRISLKSFIALG